MGPVPVLIGALLLSGMATGPAHACSPRAGYRVPGTLDLAAKADAIVIARVDGERPGRAPSMIGSVLATPLTLVHGDALPQRIEIAEAMLSDDPSMVFHSAPRELREPNRGALLGGCVRYAFARGMKLLLFLRRSADGTFVPIRATFARDAEDVRGPDALWVKAVREYAPIARLPVGARRAAMRRRIGMLHDAGDADSLAIAADMRVELRRAGTPR